MKTKLITMEAAKAVGIGRVTLQRWIRLRRIKPPKLTLRNGRGIRLWSASDIARLREAKKRIYRKDQGVKKKA